jgi:hypothetical protein
LPSYEELYGSNCATRLTPTGLEVLLE